MPDLFESLGSNLGATEAPDTNMAGGQPLPAGVQPPSAGQPMSVPAPPAPAAAPIVRPQPPAVAQAQAHNNFLGSLFKAAIGQRVGYRINPDTGQTEETPIPERPGDLFRHVLGAALVGLAAGAGAPNVMAGVARGAAAGMQAEQSADDARRQQAQQDFANRQQVGKADLEKRKAKLAEDEFEQRRIMNAATVAHWNSEELISDLDANLRNREELAREQARSFEVQKFVVENQAGLALLPNNNVPGNGDAMAAYFVKHPEQLNSPNGFTRLVIKKYDADDLRYDPKSHGWVDAKGNAADLAAHTTWSVFDVPHSAMSEKVYISGRDLAKKFGVEGLPDPNKQYPLTLGNLIALGTAKHKDDREAFNESVREKHMGLQAAYDAARVEVGSLSDQIKSVQNDMSLKPDEQKAAIAEMRTRLDDATRRMTDAVYQMNPALRPKPEQLPKPPQPGAPISADVVARYLRVYGTKDAARAAAVKDGWTIPTAAPPPPPVQQPPARGSIGGRMGLSQ